MVIFHSYVSLPEGNLRIWNNPLNGRWSEPYPFAANKPRACWWISRYSQDWSSMLAFIVLLVMGYCNGPSDGCSPGSPSLVGWPVNVPINGLKLASSLWRTQLVETLVGWHVIGLKGFHCWSVSPSLAVPADCVPVIIRYFGNLLITI